MNLKDFVALIHPILAVVFVFPLIGISLHAAWKTRQRRLQIAAGEKTKLSPLSGREHVSFGRWLAGGVVGITLVALAYAISFSGKLFARSPGEVAIVLLIFAATILSFVCLYRADAPLWRGVFAALTSAGLIVLGAQEGVFRRGYEWYVSHFYFGIVVAILMVCSVAMLPEIYRDKRWRIAHISLNTVAALLFLAQGLTGARDLLEIPLSWQDDYLSACDWVAGVCPEPASSELPTIAEVKNQAISYDEIPPYSTVRLRGDRLRQ